MEICGILRKSVQLMEICGIFNGIVSFGKVLFSRWVRWYAYRGVVYSVEFAMESLVNGTWIFEKQFLIDRTVVWTTTFSKTSFTGAEKPWFSSVKHPNLRTVSNSPTIWRSGYIVRICDIFLLVLTRRVWREFVDSRVTTFPKRFLAEMRITSNLKKNVFSIYYWKYWYCLYRKCLFLIGFLN